MIRKSILAACRPRDPRRRRARSDLRFGVGQCWGHHGWGHGGFGFYGTGVSYVDVVPSCYLVKKYNRFGEPRMIKVCE